uniref:Centriolar and ciliogenesis-associated protein HYLS1 C-terminal domain-containing protein n=1 Tax=Neogobius melanostomus TaxID=47308 RepID=A0A8C6U0M4_9GOBI
MDTLEFSEAEIQQQLELLGYKNISKEKLQEFKKDLDNLIRSGEWTTLVLAAQNRQVAPPLERLDAYSRHSVAPKPSVHVGRPNRLQTEPDPDDTLQTDSYMSTPGSGERGRLIKRKVLRKHKGQSLVCDESIYSEDSASYLDERLADLHLSTAAQRESENEEPTSHSESPGSESLSEGAFESYVRGRSRSQSDGDIRPKPKSCDLICSFIYSQYSLWCIFMRSSLCRYFQYKQLWDLFKLPGENDRKALRWEIRERLAHQPPLPKPRKVLVPNTYTVPTEKKRSALRWEIRNELATGNLPLSFNYRF